MAESKIPAEGFIEPSKPYAFIQWKGIDVCMDFACACGVRCHFDGDFAYTVQCPRCGAKWEMPLYIKPRLVSADTNPYWAENTKMLDSGK